MQDKDMEEIISNVLTFMKQGDELSQELFVESLKEMNENARNWDNLSTRDKLSLKLEFKQILQMNELGKLIKNSI
jgi:hypothetical protein